MSGERHADGPGVKQKIAHEFREMMRIFLYLAIFFCAIAAYSTLLLREYHVGYFAFGAAVLNALVISKVIMLGEFARLGRRLEDKPLLVAAVVKALQFSVLVAVFHVLEEVVKHLLHGHTAAGALRELAHGGLTEVLVRNLVIFCGLVPFFAFRELRRVLGGQRFDTLFFHVGPRALASDAARSIDGAHVPVGARDD